MLTYLLKDAKRTHHLGTDIHLHVVYVRLPRFEVVHTVHFGGDIAHLNAQADRGDRTWASVLWCFCMCFVSKTLASSILLGYWCT